MSFRWSLEIGWFLRWIAQLRASGRRDGTWCLDVIQRRLDFCLGHQLDQKLWSEQVFTSIKALGVVQKVEEARVHLGKNVVSSSEEYFLE